MALFCALFFRSVFKIKEEIRINDERDLRVQALFEATPITAKAYSVYDVTLDKKLYGHNDTAPLPLASLAKTMSLTIALNDYKDSDEVVISRNALAQDGDFGLKENEKWKAGDLAKLTLVCSANDGAYALVEKDKNYLEKMNIKATRLGLTSMKFYNATGLDISNHFSGAYGSAEDANQMAIYALKAHPDIFSITRKPEITLESESGLIHKVENTDTALGVIPNVLFSKTGFTSIAGGNLSIIFIDKMNHKVAVTVLGSTFEGRFTDMEKIVNVLQLSYGSSN